VLSRPRRQGDEAHSSIGVATRVSPTSASRRGRRGRVALTKPSTRIRSSGQLATLVDTAQAWHGPYCAMELSRSVVAPAHR